MSRIKEIMKKLIAIIRRPSMTILPGHLAFFLVLSVVPIITIIGFIASLFSFDLHTIMEAMEKALPSEVTELLLPFINGRTIDSNVWFFIIIGFLIASNGAYSITVASDTLYGMKQKSYLYGRVKALFLTVNLVMLFFFIIIVLAFGNVIVKSILDLGIFQDIGYNLYSIFRLAKWPISVVVIFFMIKLLYTMAPSHHVPSKYVNRGAWFTTLSWVLATAIYSYYVSHFVNYDIFYGGMSSLIVMMIWIYILAYGIVIGIAINTEHYQAMEKSGPDNTEELEKTKE